MTHADAQKITRDMGGCSALLDDNGNACLLERGHVPTKTCADEGVAAEAATEAASRERRQ